MFTKIRETIDSFQNPPKDLTLEEKLDAYGREVQARASGIVPLRVVRTGVLIAIALPSSYLLSSILHHLTHDLNSNMVGAVGIIIGALIGIGIQKTHDTLMKNVPFYKLNPYFGSKIDQTITAFKRA